jgi:hypothetical protein
VNHQVLAQAQGILLPRLRIMRRALGTRSPNVRSYRLLLAFAPVQDKWTETEAISDGWAELEMAGLSKEDLHELWDNEEAEVQQLDAKGEWRDVFHITYPNRDPVETD